MDPDFYLASKEGYGLDVPRVCRRTASLKTEKGKDLVVAEIDPPLIYNNLEVTEVIFGARHAGYSVLSPGQWPVYVHVAIWKDPNTRAQVMQSGLLAAGGLEVIAWGELYATKGDALAAVAH